ncbi:MAG: SDR family NAD(P)-dependent oxidoreductase [Acidimicrobiales bacterium]
MRIANRAVVVTGASSGIGRETARLLAAHGGEVLAVARSRDALATLASEQQGIEPLVADLATEAGRAAVAGSPIGARAEVLVNNAGIGWLGRFEDMSADDVSAMVDLNVVATIDLCRLLLPTMLDRRCGHIVNVASVASWLALPSLTVYSATKFGVQGFSEGLRRELAGRGVAVTTVNPGPVDTRFGARARGGDRPTDELAEGPWPGVPASWVARAVVRAVRMGGAPGYVSIAVPRVIGFARLGALPGARLVVDAGNRLIGGRIWRGQ